MQIPGDRPSLKPNLLVDRFIVAALSIAAASAATSMKGRTALTSVADGGILASHREER